jgi:hypothetical protein
MSLKRRSSSRIVLTESTWWTTAMPTSRAGPRLAGMSSTNTQASGVTPSCVFLSSARLSGQLTSNGPPNRVRGRVSG